MERGYQYGFSSTSTAVHDVLGRERKVKTMVCVLKDFLRKPLADLSLLNVGCWGLKKLVRRFRVHDYTKTVVCDPLKFHVDYMIKPGSAKAAIAKLVVDKFPWLTPGYIWLLEKPLW